MKTAVSIVAFVLSLLMASGAHAELSANKQVYAHNDLIELTYTNVPTNRKNWLGVWRYQDGPGTNKIDVQDGPWHKNQTNRANSWTYTTQTSGQYVLNGGTLAPGRYAAFLLKEDGYAWLSTPVIFDVADQNGYIELKTLGFNIWNEGTKVSGGFDAIVNEIASTNADIVGLSEVRNYGGVDFTQKLANALRAKGFAYFTYKAPNDVGVLSRFPIGRHATISEFTKALIQINGINVAFYSGHLDYTNYAAYLPRGYDANFHGTLPGPVTQVESVLSVNDASRRPSSIRAFIADAQTERDAGHLVLLAGDFNEPSWLDWIHQASTMFDRNGAVIPWTSTKLLSEANFQDAYRVKYASPILNPGFTWVSDNPNKQVGELTWAPKVDERDRIDFIFYYPNPSLSVKDAVIVGPSTSIVKSQRTPEQGSDRFKIPEGVWPSDHKALLITFSLRAALQ